jgi:hypothetical protein
MGTDSGKPLYISTPPHKITGNLADKYCMKRVQYSRKKVGEYGTLVGKIFLTLFALPFCYAGILLGKKTLHMALEGPSDWTNFVLYVVSSLVFGGFGFSLLWLVLSEIRILKEKEALEKRFPDKSAWKKKNRPISDARGLWIFAGFWNLVGMIVLFSSLNKLGSLKTETKYSLLINLTLGLGFLILAIHTTIKWRKFVESISRPVTVPEPIGENPDETNLSKLGIILLLISKFTVLTGFIAVFSYIIYEKYFAATNLIRLNRKIPLVASAMMFIGALPSFFYPGYSFYDHRKAAKRYAQREKKRAQAEKKRIERIEVGGWGYCADYAQFRRRVPTQIEFRRTIPLLMVAGMLLFISGLDMAFLGKILRRKGLLPGLTIALAGPPVFLIGRGVVIDGTTRKIRRWLGWVYKPIIWFEDDVSKYETLEIDKKLGPKSVNPRVGRSVHYRLYLVTRDKKRVLLEPCTWVKDARALAREISGLIGLPIQDNSGEPPDKKRKPRKEPDISPPPGIYRGPQELEKYVREHIVEIAEEQFPDNPDLEWNIHRFEYRDGLTIVEVEPETDEVGYSRFKFVVSPTESGDVDVDAIYCLKDGVYSLLSTSYGLKKKLPKFIK